LSWAKYHGKQSFHDCLACPQKNDVFAMVGFGSKNCLLGGVKCPEKDIFTEQIIFYLREA
jgi:hypothetical protein